ncbi:YdbL family protein [Photobacterium sp. SDRW27]|uniref:YdbL family protein n=1 Tax=Photobacterium obscurum TaxID=2829490 RepID=UPI002242D13A|nr:YdbL family protein [Photobacterium obscurum]MCW8329425.1 YdbL family protein [Photobacterium obscurum]
MKNFLVLFFAIFISANAYALDLQQAKDQGLIGEANTGYIAAVTSNVSGEVRQLIAKVNNHRKERYKKIAVSHGLTTTEVGRLAHKRAIEKTEPGNYYQNAAGKWLKK